MPELLPANAWFQKSQDSSDCQCKEEGDLPSPDRRGKHTPPNKLDEKYLKDIDNHIMSFDPSISHYRRVHAPNRLYLPSELSINRMFKDYEAGGGKLSYEIYRRQLNMKNTSFAKLGHEECEMCLKYENHSCENEEEVVEGILDELILKIESKEKKNTHRVDIRKKSESCEVCIEYNRHLFMAKQSRKG